ncbi:unnamed protein product [Durusdinium trenchii]|uniref:Reverse transcriptase Ty1/copia-type domain-containing protein n=1 Tax=Durusdinium trenchii TaxID=1381693 RepID=A0ABP0NFP0_9DINO
MSGFAGRRRRSSREGERLQDPEDREGRLRVGAADERLQALLEEREGRAASVPARTAAVRRLAAAPEQAGQAATTSSARRQSLDVLQRAFGGNPQGGPLSYGPTIELGPQPRVLEPYPMATPPPMSGVNVNPFWSTQARAHPGESGVVPEGMPQGEVRRSPNYVDVEAIREKVLREAENLFAKEIKKATGGAESSSFESVPSADREPGRSTVGVMGPGGGGNGGESTRGDGRGSQPHGLERPPGLLKEGVCEGPLNRSELPQGTVNEVFRSLELPPLPSPGSDGASLAFGDWLTVAMPLMSDLSSSARGWWQANIMEAEALYETWLKLKPLERLRLKVDRPLHPSYERVEHRGVTILLGVLPDQVRRDVIASRKVSCLGILFRLYTIFQPGGSAERTALLKSITELKVGNGVADVLSGIRQWRRWIQRVQELGLTTPDPLVLVQVLNRVTEALGRHGGAQAEAEDLALMTGSSKTPAAGANVNMSTAGGTAPKEEVRGVPSLDQEDLEEENLERDGRQDPPELEDQQLVEEGEEQVIGREEIDELRRPHQLQNITMVEVMEDRGQGGGTDRDPGACLQVESNGSCGGSAEGMVKCLECDLWQLGEHRGAGCRFCEGDLPKEQDGLQVPGEEALDLQACSWTQAVQWHEEEVRSHWQLKRMWLDQLNQVAVGAQQGSEHGGWLQVLEEQLMVREECLQRQHGALESWRMAALQAAGGSGEGEEQKPSLVLQTYTVSLAQVRRELHKWVEPFKDEYVSLSTTTGAIFPTTEEALKKDPRYPWREEAPAMLVPTVKSPHGRHRARVVICGNHLTKSQVETKAVSPLEASSISSPFELYAGGADATVLRALLRKSALEKWSVASLDVKTAFLLAPRRDAQQRLLITRPPRALVEAKVCDADEIWEVRNSLYGLQEAPLNWARFRDEEMAKFRWTDEGENWKLARTQEPNLWKVILDDPSKSRLPDKVYGFVAVYVDDILVTGDERVTRSTIARFQQQWKCSTPEWLTPESSLRFCGFEIAQEKRGLRLHQESYLRDLLARYPDVKSAQSPLPGVLDETEETNPEVAEVKEAEDCVQVKRLIGPSQKEEQEISTDVMSGRKALQGSETIEGEEVTYGGRGISACDIESIEGGTKTGYELRLQGREHRGGERKQFRPGIETAVLQHPHRDGERQDEDCESDGSFEFLRSTG